MIQWCPETEGILYGSGNPPGAPYRSGDRPELEAIARRQGWLERPLRARPEAIARFVADLAPHSTLPLDQLRFGGTEEEIVARGSDWCPDVARVACAFAQVVGLPARLVILVDPSRAYSGHTIVEVWSEDRWGAVDAVRGRVHRTDEGAPASAADLAARPELRPGTPGMPEEGAAWVAIADYPLGPVESADYSVGRINDYYRTILSMSERGWPGGMRWLFGEDDR